MKRSMAGYSGGSPAKMARTADHLLNPSTTQPRPLGPPSTIQPRPLGLPSTSFQISPTIADFEKLQARNTELDKLNKEIYALLKDSIKQAKEDVAAVRADATAKINAIRDHHAKLQGEIASLNRPRRRTTLRKEIEEYQQKVDGLETELRNSEAEKIQLREAVTNAERERDELKLRLEAMEQLNGRIIDNNIHPTPPQSQGSIISPVQQEPFNGVDLQMQPLNGVEQQFQGINFLQQPLNGIDAFNGIIPQQQLFNGNDFQEELLNGSDFQEELLNGSDSQEELFNGNESYEELFNGNEFQESFNGNELQPSFTPGPLEPNVGAASASQQILANHSHESASDQLPNTQIDQFPVDFDHQPQPNNMNLEPLLWGNELPGLDFDAYIDIDALLQNDLGNNLPPN